MFGPFYDKGISDVCVFDDYDRSIDGVGTSSAATITSAFSSTFNKIASLTSATYVALDDTKPAVHQQTLIAVQLISTDFSLSLASKQIEPWRQEGDSWRAALPSNIVLFDAYASRLRQVPENFDSAVGEPMAHNVAS